nr:integrase, catalytic region, zinc finger, CCHC-type, peptidase aspartic, catalytic [Tanacetum cinerariifolium]
MCLVRECWTELHEMAMAAFKSQYIDKDTYLASTEDIEMQFCFLDDQLTNLSPPRNLKDLCAAYAMNNRTASNRATVFSSSRLFFQSHFMLMTFLQSESDMASLMFFDSVQVTKGDVDRRYAYLTNQHDETMSPFGLVPLREEHFLDIEDQDLNCRVQVPFFDIEDKGIAISELKKLIEKLKGKSVEIKFEKSSINRQPNAFKSQRSLILGKPTIFSDSLEKKDCSKSKSVTKNNVSNDFPKPVTALILPPNGVISPTNVSIPQLKSNQMEDKVMLNNSQGKKQEVEDHHRNVKFSNNKMFLIEIILFIVESGCSKHMTGNLKLLTNFVEKVLGTVKFRNDQIAPILGYGDLNHNLFSVGTIKFGNDQIAPILGYGDLVQGAITIKRVYYVEGFNHNLFFVGQFYDADLEVAFRKSTCYSRDLKGNNLLTGSRGTDLYLITLQDINYPNPICLMAKASSSQA